MSLLNYLINLKTTFRTIVNIRLKRIELTRGKKNLKLPFSMTMSPSNLPKSGILLQQVKSNPNKMRKTPVMISILPIFLIITIESGKGQVKLQVTKCNLKQAAKSNEKLNYDSKSGLNLPGRSLTLNRRYSLRHSHLQGENDSQISFKTLSKKGSW